MTGAGALPQGSIVNGRYRVERRLGAGSIGEVYLASDEQLHCRRVAVKILNQDSMRDPYLARKFHQEMEALARVNHPGIVAIYDSGKLADGSPFLVMQYVDGQTLRSAVRSDPRGMDLGRVAAIARQLGHALSLAHERDIVHRDLKPDNIMLQDLGETDERVQIIDFGIARVKDSQVAATGTTRVAGSLPYMAPEQLMRKPSAASDIYALGVIAYEMVTGRQPFSPATAIDLIKQQQNGPRVKPVDLREDMPEEASEVILKAMAFDASERYRRARDFSEELFRTLSRAPDAEARPHAALPDTTPVVFPSQPPSRGAEPEREPAGEIAHVLFLDAVGFSRLMAKEQVELLMELQTIVRGTADYKRAQAAAGQLVVLPTGDGMALAFFADLESPVRCAIDIARALKGHAALKLRMGLHTGPVIRIRDVNERTNVTGGGINIAQRVMDCGDAGHILLSQEHAGFLAQFSGQWASSLHDIGEHTVKHGVRLRLYNLYTGDAGRLELPEKLAGDGPSIPPPPPPPPPAVDAREKLLIQIVNISHCRDDNGRESLVYAPVPWGLGEAVAEPEIVDVRSTTLAACIAAVESDVRELTRRAVEEHPRGERDLRRSAAELAFHAMRRGGLDHLLAAGVHPQLNIIRDLASQIPWEVLPNADEYLSYLVAGRGRAPSDAHEFLLVDPGGDSDHLARLRHIVTEAGFDAITLAGPQATAQRFVDALRQRRIAGLYVNGRADSGLHLTDRTVSPAEVLECGASVPFVWLNACVTRANDVTGARLEGAEAFARGGSWKTVIAPRWPVASAQAAQFALDFFEHAAHGASVGVALRDAKKRSRERYDADRPDVAWCAYRLFGDPNRPLPSPARVPAAIVVPEDVPDLAVERVFDAQWQLDRDVFAFSIDAVLLRAVKRRNLQERAQVNVTDFCAGLVRKGDLTRYVLRDLHVDPDELYAALGEQRDEGAKADASPVAGTVAEGEEMAEELLRQVLAKWEVGDRSDFEPDLVRILKAADTRAQRRNGGADSAISERDLLELIVADEAWSGRELLPPRNAMEGVLRRIASTGAIDANGHLILTDIAADAREIIEAAHRMAQQRGMSVISHRVLLAAFFLESDGCAAKALARIKPDLDPDLVFALMVAVSEKPSDAHSPIASGLSMEACRRIVWPTLQAARQSARVTEEALLDAFCRCADASFKELTRSFGLDLDALRAAQGPLGGLAPDARRIIDDAHELAQRIGARPPIRNRILLAAFLQRNDGAAARACRSRGADPRRLADDLLRSAGGSGVRCDFVLDDAARTGAIAETVAKARELAGGGTLDEATLFRAFSIVAPPELKRALQPHIDLDGLANDDTNPPQASFDDASRTALVEAARLAREHGWDEIRSPYLFATLLDHGIVPAENFDAGDLRRLVISTVPRGPGARSGPSDAPRLSANTALLVERAQRIAGDAGRSAVTCDDLFAAFRADVAGPLFPLLQSLSGGVSVAAASRQSGSLLDRFGVDLTEKARQGKLPEIVGRDAEIDTALDNLQMVENANPLLVGESGVGKTAIVEGVARRIAAGRCPARLRSARVIELSVGGLIANTRYRGELEERIQQVLVEARGDVILFIDEIHTIAGAGAAEHGGPDAGNMLKAALARGELRLIGATTNSEYRASIERDRALARRFQLQRVAPPTRDATLSVLASRQASLEAHHRVHILDEARTAAVDLSGRYILDKQWPAKARDVLERACIIAGGEPSASGTPLVTSAHVAAAVSRITSIPVERVSASDSTVLANLEESLARRANVQADGSRIVAEAIRRGRNQTRDRAWCVLLFVGPTDRGQKDLARAVAEDVYGGAEGMHAFDMSRFSDPRARPRFLAALVERLRRNPYSLVLCEDVERAHEDVLAIVRRLSAEGTIVDDDGNIADGRNSIIILTSASLDPQRASTAVGFTPAMGPGDADLRLSLERLLPRTFLAGIDAIVPFQPSVQPEQDRHAARRPEELS